MNEEPLLFNKKTSYDGFTEEPSDSSYSVKDGEDNCLRESRRWEGEDVDFLMDNQPLGINIASSADSGDL